MQFPDRRTDRDAQPIESKRATHRGDLPARVLDRARRVDDEVCQPPLLGITHLLGEDRVELRLAHALPFQDTRPLHLGRCARHDGGVDVAMAPRLEEERHVEDRDAPTLAPCPLQSGRLRLAHQRVDDRLQIGERSRIAEHLLRQPRAVDDAVCDRAGEALRDERHRSAAIERVHGLVRIVQGVAVASEEARRGRLAHPDRAGEADDDHRSSDQATAVKASRSPHGAAPRRPPERCRTSARSRLSPGAGAFRAHPPRRGPALRRPQAAA